MIFRSKTTLEMNAKAKLPTGSLVVALEDIFRHRKEGAPLFELDYLSRRGTNVRILIAEDEPDLLRILKVFFKSRGDSVAVADNGEQAWEIFSGSPEQFDVVLTDHRMPVMSGIEFINQLRKNDFTVPVVIMSGDQEVFGDSDIANDIVELLYKPIRLVTLERVFSQIESSRAH